MSRQYVILNADEVSSIDFDQVFENSADTLRYNVNPVGTRTFVKYEGNTPSFLIGKTANTHAEMLEILASDEWTPPIEP